MRISRTLLAVLVSAAALFGASAVSQAAPLPTHVATMKAVAASDALKVRWGGGWHGGGWHGGGWHGGGWHGGWAHRGWGHRPLGWGAAAAGAVVGGALVSGAYYGSDPYYSDSGYTEESYYPYGGGCGCPPAYHASPYSYGW